MTEQQDADSGDSGADGARDYEAEALEKGWKPQDEWSGDKTKWKDAKSYVEYGDLKDSIHKKIAAEYEGRFSKLEKVTSKTIQTMERAHKAEFESLKAQRREAVKAGDVDAVERFDEAIEQARDAAPLTDDPAEQVKQAEAAFAKEHTWYGTDRKLTAFARGFSQDLARSNPSLSMEDNIKQVLAAVKEEFPEKFETKKPAANGHAAVDGGSDAPSAPRSGLKGWAQLPSEAKRAYDRYDQRVKKALSKEDFAKQYFEEA